MQQFKGFAEQFLDFLFPPRCVHCQQIGHVLCPLCIAQIKLLQPPLCYKCCTPLLNRTLCPHCSSHPLRLNGLRIAGNYQEPLRSYIHLLKYRGHTRLGDPLGRLLAQVYLDYGMQADCIIPVPLHPERERARGYNQALLLAQSCARSLHLPLYTTLLHRGRPTSAQVDLSWQDRQHNVLHAFQCDQASASRLIPRRRIVIIDDVCTTAATLTACAQPLFEAGAGEIWGLVLARPL